MLKRMIINNFKSYKIKSSIELEKTNYQMLSSTNVTNNILKGIMFVGANASGKSNSILAIKFLLDSLFGKQENNISANFCMFSNEPTMELVYDFVIDNNDISYLFNYHKYNNLIKEELKLNNKIVLFREGKFAKSNISEQIRFDDIPDNSLFLRDVYFSTKFRGNEILQKWFKFLSSSIYLDLYNREIFTYKDINLSLKDYLENNGLDTINDFFDKYNFGQTIEYDKNSYGPTISVQSDEKMIYFKRKDIEDPIPYIYESIGNKNLLHLLPAFFTIIQNGGLLLLDEFSSGFHNDLEELLIKYFMQNAKNSQILFVSHSTNLLSNSLLRPDQIYSVEFDQSGTHLNRFSNERPREAQNIEKMYLSGVFKGVPNYEHNT